MTRYEDFLATKLAVRPPTGLSGDQALHPSLFPFQSDLVRWALRRGRAAIFAATGLGKMRMELEWARVVAEHHNGRVLILAPLAVASNLEQEAALLGVRARVYREQAGPWAPIAITNYERLHKFDASDYVGVVLDESSCIKHFESAGFKDLTDRFRQTPFRLAATATPAPNDYVEFGTHAEFLGICSRTEMLAEYFVHDGGETSVWRLKGHARKQYWRWLASWGALVRMPSDLGYDDGPYVLPSLEMHERVIPATREQAFAVGRLFVDEAATLTDQRAARRASLDARVEQCPALVNDTREPFIVWCDLNKESEALADAIPDAIEVTGSQNIDEKEDRIGRFIRREARVLVSKPSICGWGLNLQFASRMAFVGVTHSWEAMHQAIRRCWRFGQRSPVHVHLFLGEAERAVLASLQRKEIAAREMGEELARETRDVLREEVLGHRPTKPRAYAPRIEMPAWLSRREADCE